MAMAIESKLASAEKSLIKAKEQVTLLSANSQSKEYKKACIRLKSCETRIKNLTHQLKSDVAEENKCINMIQTTRKIELEHNEAYCVRFMYLADAFNGISCATTQADRIVAETNAVRKVIDRFTELANSLSYSVNFQNVTSTRAQDFMAQYFIPNLQKLNKSFNATPTTNLKHGELSVTYPLRKEIYKNLLSVSKCIISNNKHIQKYIAQKFPTSNPLMKHALKTRDSSTIYFKKLAFNLCMIEAFDALLLISCKTSF